MEQQQPRKRGPRPKPPEDRYRRRHLTMPPALDDKLDRLADAAGVSASEWVQQQVRRARDPT